MNDGVYQWTAFDPARWDHYYHAGQQVRFYRQQPPHLANAEFEIIEPRWVGWLLGFMERFHL